MPLPKKTRRNIQIWYDKKAGMRNQDIARKYGICVYRVYEILKQMGYNFYAVKDG